ncbi:MAG: hypothetical protein IKP48_11410 [Bacteroidaceae bacterium]|nr:hypothetical protein [Bacteroidaceae bacterium]
MQKKYIGIVAGLLFLAGCSDNDQVFNQVNEGSGADVKAKSFTSFTASMDGAADTRAYIVNGSAHGNKSLAWNEDLNEWIHVFSNTDLPGVSTDYKLQSVSDNVGNFVGNAVSGDTFYAVYANQGWERDVNDSNLLKFHVGDYYEYPTSLNNFQFFGPMIATSTTNSFQLKQLTGMIHVSVSGIHRLMEVSLQATGREPISGDFMVDLREPTKLVPVDGSSSSVDGVWFGEDGMSLGNEVIDIYFPISPTTFKQGFSMIIQGEDMYGNDVELTKTYSKLLTIGRAEVKHFNLVNVTGEMEPVEKSERDILMDLYYATDGAHWTVNTNWGSDKPLNEWYGVRTYNGSVYDIDLQQNNLNGYIPQSIGGLKNLNYFYVSDNSLSGAIPDGLWTLTQLRGLDLSSNTGLSGSLPENIGDLTNLYYLGLYQCSKIGGEIPESFYTLKKLQILSIAFCSFSGSFSENFGNLESLEDIRMCGNQMSGPLPESIGNLKNLRVLMIRWNNLTGDLPATMGNMTSLESIYLEGNQLTGTIPDSFMNLSNLTWMNISGNCMSGTISEKMYKSDWWSQVQISMSQRDGYGLSIEGLYTSTDFSKNGYVREIQKHSKGNGIKLVITGEGFSDRLIANGTFDNYVERAVEYFFDIEPYTSFRAYFDVYSVTAVSKNDVVGADTSFGMKVSGDKYIFNVDNVANFLKRSMKSNGVDNVTTLVIVNDAVSGGRVSCKMFSDGFSVGLCTVSEDMMEEINHEIGGHGFGHLADEYWNDDQSGSTFPLSQHSNLDGMHAIGWYLNVDYQNDPSKVLWSDFISDPAYAAERIGVYEGGYANFTYGIYRPTENSIMRDNVGEYNAPSRWAIYQRLMDLAGESYSFASFLEYDKKNLANTRNFVERAASNKVKHGVPPVFYNYPSTEIGKR